MLFGIARFVSPFVIFLYPAYSSYKTIKNNIDKDRKFWLAYWIVFGFFFLIEFWLEAIFSALPLYYEFKIIFFLWLQLPKTRGAEKLYNDYVEPFLTSHESDIDKQVKNSIELVKEHGGSYFKLGLVKLKEFLINFLRKNPEVKKNVTNLMINQMKKSILKETEEKVGDNELIKEGVEKLVDESVEMGTGK